MTLAGYFINQPHVRATIVERLEQFDKAQISFAGMVMLMQDLLEAGALSELPPKYTTAALHCLAHGYCTINGRALQ